MPKSKITTNEEKTLTAILTLSGVGEKESKIYWILLNNGKLTGTEIIAKSGYKRGNTYALIHQLHKKGLVTSVTKDKKTYFQPEPPQKVMALLEKKAEETDQAKNFYQRLLPHLSSRYKIAVDKPIVRYFEGENGVRKVYDEIYNSFNKVVRGCVDLNIIKKDIWTHIMDRLRPLRIKNQVYSYSLHPEKSGKKIEDDKTNLKKVFNVDPEKYPLPCEVDVWDDKVAFLSFKKDEFVGTIIQNQDFATTLDSVFRLCFDCMAGKDRSEVDELSRIKKRLQK